METPSYIMDAANVIKDADALLITAGAGIGVDSGLPDFRGDTGFWRAYPPIAKLGISFYEMANPQWFNRDPSLAWAFYGHRLNLYRATEPNLAFIHMKEIAEKLPGGYFVFTSNVDGQFQKAGYRPEKIEECHGSIHHLQCVSNCSDDIWRADGTEILIDEEQFRALEPLPACKHCGGLSRPNVLMFGDWTWTATRSDVQHHRFRTWLQEIMRHQMRIAVIEIGAGESVPTVRRQSESVALNLNSKLIRINPRDYHVPRGHISVPLGAADGMEKIYQQWKQLK